MRIELAQCVLRSFRPNDASAIAEGANNRKVWLKLRDLMPHPYQLEHAETFLLRVLENKGSHTTCIEVEGKAAGVIGLDPGHDVHRRTAELGYWLAEPYWGRGIMTAAVRAFVSHGFETLPLDRIYASVYEKNPASARILEKSGFQFEGRMRKNVIKDGQILDSLLYAKLRDTPPRS